MLKDDHGRWFTPAINARSDRLVQDSLGLPADFLARQQHMRTRHEMKLARLAQRLVSRVTPASCQVSKCT